MSLFSFVTDAFRRAQRPPQVAPLEPAIVSSSGVGGALDIIDITKVANPWKVDGDGKRWCVRGKRRKPKQIDRVVFHQTACLMGTSPQRYVTLGAHYGIPQRGPIIRVYEDEWLIWAANNLSQASINIELDGRFFGIDDDIATIWDDPTTKLREQPTELTDVQKRNALALGRHLARKIIASGTRFRGFYSHRQSSRSRRNDPGAEPYREIIAPLNYEFGVDAGGLDWHVDEGRGIPREWDPESATRY